MGTTLQTYIQTTQIHVSHWDHVFMRTGLSSKLFMSYKELPVFLKWFYTEADTSLRKIFYYLSPAPPIFKNDLTHFFDDNNIVGGSEYRSGQGRRGGGEEKERGRSQKLNHSHVSNLRVIFLLPKDINQIKLALLWMKEREYNIVNQSNYQLCDTH